MKGTIASSQKEDKIMRLIPILCCIMFTALASSGAANAATSPEHRYAVSVTKQVNQIGQTVGSFKSLMLNPEPKDQSWLDALAVSCVQMRLFLRDAKALSVPQSCRKFQNEYLKACSLYSYVGQHFIQALADKDEAEADACLDKLEAAHQHLVQAYPLMPHSAW